MKITKIISSFLAVLMLISAFTLVMSADEVQYEYNTSNQMPTMSYFTGTGVVPVLDKEGKPTGNYESDAKRFVYTKEDKLETMDLRYSKDGYELYVDAYSGEVATRCIATGEILFSNPYNIADSTAQDSIKKELMSQLVVKYVDVATGDENTYYSYEWAAERGQIVVRNIKNGIRVEYTIGREEARMLVPRQIEKNSFDTKILNVLKEAVAGDSYAEFQLKKLMAYYILQDPSAVSDSYRAEMEKKYPITKKMSIYVLDSSTAATEMAKIEQMIKTYCPDYSYEDLDEDHMKVEYEAEDKNPPLFKMALEYSVDASGMTVRLPANGIRFNEALYQLYSIEILPYMGAGANSANDTSVFLNNSGYNFFPDGSGSLFDFNKITDIGSSTTVTGKVYGQDYAYHTITGTHQEIIRYPVFGIVKTEDENRIARREALDAIKAELTAAGTTGVTDDIAAEQLDETLYPVKEQTSGFVAIVEEGDALMELSTYHAVRTSEYNTIKMTVYPRPQDTYNVADAISVGQNDTWTVVSSRKYTGNYRVRYIMLTDESVAAEKEVSDYYDCSYTGMAMAYREYLEGEGILTRLTSEDVKEQLPLYIETFGALYTTEKFLSIPVEVMTPLTTYADIKTMRTDLSAKGINNINFILTGYAKGGISARQVPYNLKWEKAAEEGGMDFEELLAEARANGYGIYPDFDFAYAQSNAMFDGLTMKDHSVKTIDDRYTTKREYSATKQTYVSYFDIAISPAYFSHFYTKLAENYLEYAPMGISVSTLGTALNSDFDEDEPYNREDSKNFTVKAFEYLDSDKAFADGKILTSGGNAYTWKYVDYITDIALDSSRYAQSSASVPFLGMVLHGYKEIAGTPINMEGNIDYAILKAIENGASLKFILSYRNTNNLKIYEDLSKYYSVRYDIWFDDVVEIYNELNTLLAGVQTSTIVDHKFVDGIRVPDDDELINDAMTAIDKAIENSTAYKESLEQAEKDAYRNARLEIEKILADIQAANKDQTCKKLAEALNTALSEIKLDELKTEYDGYKAELAPKKAAMDAIADKESAEYKAALQAFNDAKTSCLINMLILQNKLTLVQVAAQSLFDATVELKSKIALADGEYKALVMADQNLTEAQRNAILAQIEKIKTTDIFVSGTLDEAVASINATVKAKYDEIIALFATYEGDAAGGIFEDKELQGRISEIPVYEIEVIEEEIVDTTPQKVETPVYSSDENKIVYEEYENGTKFLLNFNNYTVKVVVNNVSYIVEAYGYVVLTGKN